jgi:AcrR family transcriptional regulator
MPGEPITRRGRASRERIVERAAELFAERGTVEVRPMLER